MALNSCASLGYAYGSSFCLPVSVDVEQNEFTYDDQWVAGAFILGFGLGVVIVLLLATYCFNAMKQNQDSSDVSQKVQVTFIETPAVNGWSRIGGETSVASDKTKKTISGVLFGRQKKPNAQKHEDKGIQENLDPAVAHGMVDVMLQTSKCESEVEMAKQDMVAIISMERSKEEEMATLMQHVLTILLRKKMKERAITKNFFYGFIKKAEEDIQDVNKIINRERDEDEKKLRKDPKLSKDTQTLETELQKSQSHYNNKQRKLENNLRNNIRHDLKRSSGLKENEINDLMAELTRNMAVAEENIGLEQERQRRALEIRLARRKQVIEYMEMEAKEREQDKDARVEKIRNLLPLHVNGSHRLESHADSIVNEVANELDGIRKYYFKESYNACKDKNNFLQNSRLKNFSKLNKDQDKEKAELLHTSVQTTNALDFVQKYLKLKTDHDEETRAFWEYQDQEEVKEIFQIIQEVARQEVKKMEAEIENVVNKLTNETSLSSEVGRIMKLYKAEMDQYNAEKQKEKQAALARLQERLQQRLKAADLSEKQYQKEQEITKKEQMATLNKVLAMNIDLNEAEKTQILKEHEQNMKAFSNQLLCSRLRQQKSLEIRLNQRKIHLENLNQRKINLQKSNKHNKDNQLAKLSADITKEEKLFEEARQAAVTELRKQLAKETEEALKVQADSISQLIGRLQLGEARRKVILAHQEDNLKKLQDDLDKKMESSVTMSSEMEKILKQHNDNMTYLEQRLQRHREEEEKRIQEKIHAKKWRLEQESENELEEEAKSEYNYQLHKGTGYASLALIQLHLKLKHEKAMQALNDEMVSELEKSKSDLNLEYELELKKGLEVQMQKTLSKMAALTGLPRNDVEAAVSAVISGNTDSKVGQQLMEDLRLSSNKKIQQQETAPNAEQPQ